jgi:hypothetical protein
MIELPSLTAEALIVAFATPIYLGGIALWLFIPWMGRFRDSGYVTEDEQAKTPSRLFRNCRVQFVTRGEEADLREISEHVQTSEPPMRQDDRPYLDFHFYNRAN